MSEDLFRINHKVPSHVWNLVRRYAVVNEKNTPEALAELIVRGWSDYRAEECDEIINRVVEDYKEVLNNDKKDN